MIIAIDFDGTLCRGTYPEIAGEQPYATKVMQQLKDDGHYLIINTCRSGEQLLDAINWLLHRKIPFDRVNDNEPGNVDKYGNNSRKIYAHVYIDDKNLGGFPGWEETYSLISKMEAEYTQKLDLKTT